MFDRKRPGTFFLTLLLIFVPSAAAVAGTVQGQIRYENLAIQSALVAIAGQQALTAGDGRYSIEAVPAGTRTITVTAGGYRTERRQIEVPATGVVTQDFQLNLDLLFADQVVVTGTYSPRTKRESSVAITTVNDQQIAARQPRNTADLLRVVPGFYVESSGGEVGNNLWARGLPADGSYRYVALMEDGMPVYDATELFFVNADIFLRVDENIAEMEAVRGGNSALFGSNAPGGVVNFISKVGAQEAATTLKFTAGTDGLARVGFQHGGPLTERWTYNIGGFYRYDQGVRDPGFPASEGGQLKLNLTRQLDRGYLRVYGKYLNDSNIFYLPLPFQAGGDFVQGFPLDGTLATPEANFLRVPLPNQQGTLELPLQDGQRQNGFWIMGEIFLDLPGGWSLQNMARGMSVDHQWNALVPFDMVRPETFAGDFVPAGGSFRYSFVNHDQPFSAPNDLLLVAGLWHVEKPMSSFSDQLQFTRRIEAAGARHSVALGGYFSHYRADNTWYFTNILTDVRHQPRLVDLFVADAAGNEVAVTKNGFRNFTDLYVNGRANVDVFALFASDEIEMSDRLRLDIGARFETNTYRQNEELTTRFNLGDPTTLADDNVSGGTGRFRHPEQTFDEWALSVGANYLLSENLAIWGRGSRGYKMPILDNFLFGGDNLEAEQIFQVEAGAKFGSPRLGLNSSIYLLRIQDFPSQDARVVDGQTVFVTAFVGEAETIGLETELVSEPFRNFRIDAGLTLQRPEYTDFIEGQQDFKGNQIRRVPELIGDLTLTYGWERTELSGNWHYIADRWSNNANTIELPSFDVTSFRASYRINDSTRASLGVLNAFNSKGLTEGNPRLDESAVEAGLFFLARPVLPRRVVLELEYNF